MIKQNWFLCLLHYIILVGVNVPDTIGTPVGEQNLDPLNNLKSKREVGDTGENLSNYDLGDLQKRAPKMFLGMRGKKIPSGFMGVRGRRLDSPYYGGDQSLLWDNDSPSNLEDEALTDILPEKRGTPFSFMGMLRGRKLPSGFVRVRGRRIPVAFLGMRGKKNEIYNGAAGLTSDAKEQDKRALPSGFLGMRGKKQSSLHSGDSVSDSLNFDTANNFGFTDWDQNSFPKRAPAAFLGMRG